jgi:voltage-gated sodium channel
VLIPAVREQAQLLRLLRLARFTRLVRFLPDARILMLTVVKSSPSLFSMVVLTLLLLFIYGMLGWALFGEALPQTWGYIGQAMLSCFVLLTLENFPTYLEAAQPVSPFATVFFVSYVLLAAFIVFNMLIGIVIGSMERAREAQAATERALDESGLLQRIADMRESMEVLEAEVTAQVIAARRDPSPGS